MTMFCVTMALSYTLMSADHALYFIVNAIVHVIVNLKNFNDIGVYFNVNVWCETRNESLGLHIRPLTKFLGFWPKIVEDQVDQLTSWKDEIDQLKDEWHHTCFNDNVDWIYCRLNWTLVITWMPDLKTTPLSRTQPRVLGLVVLFRVLSIMSVICRQLFRLRTVCFNVGSKPKSEHWQCYDIDYWYRSTRGLKRLK